MATHSVIYDGDCNLCATLVQLLEWFDRGKQFYYIPMQDTETLSQYGVTAEECELGMLLIDESELTKRWQGSEAAEEIGNLLPAGNVFVAAYRGLPGLKRGGDRFYTFIRDNRYQLFGRRSSTYTSSHRVCSSDRCDQYFSS